MAWVFYVIGWIVIIVGVIMTGVTVSQMGNLSETLGNATSMNVAALVPVVTAIGSGVGIIFGGLLILAIGGVLSRLDRIARNTRPVRG